MKMRILFLMFWLLLIAPSSLAIIFDVTAYGGTNTGSHGPDPSGLVARMVPLTQSYTPPAGAVYVSPTGNDTTGDGTKGNPYATINKAYSVAEKVVLRGGIHRLTSSLRAISWPLTLQAYSGEVPYVLGTTRISTWTPDTCGAVACWYTENWTFWDQYFDDAPNLSAAPAQFKAVWIDDNPHDGTWTRLTAVATRAEVSVGEMFFDSAASRIYIGSDPNTAGRFIEVARFTGLFFAISGSANSVVKGVVFKGFGTSPYDGNGSGVIYLNNPDGHWTIENNVFVYNTYRSIKLNGQFGFTTQYNDVIRQNAFLYNGGGGIAAYQRNGLLVQENYFGHNNTQNFSFNGALGDAGNKFLSLTNLTIRDNLAEDENANGFWCDTNCTNFIFIHNIVRRSAQTGLFVEATGTGPFIVAGNLVYDNPGGGVAFNAGNGRIFNNTLLENGICNFCFDIGGLSNTVDNNILSDAVAGLLPVQALNRVSNDIAQITNSNTNIYHRTVSSAPTVAIRWGASDYNTLAAFQSAVPTREVGSLTRDNVAASTVFTLNQTTGVYSVPGGSAALSAGTALPADIATLLGITASPVNIGYLALGGAVAVPNPPTNVAVK